MKEGRDSRRGRKSTGLQMDAPQNQYPYNLLAANSFKQPIFQGTPKMLGSTPNSIAFGSAPRREVDSQPISPRASKQAVRQIHTVWVFCQWQMRPQAAGRSSGRVVTQTTGIRVVGGLNPGLQTFAPPPAAAALKVSRPGFEPTPARLVPAALPLDRWPCYQHLASPLLVAY